MKFLPHFFAVLAFLACAVAPALAAERTMIVLDGSGSMWAQIDGTARIDIARKTLATVLEKVPTTLELGLITYGHRSKGDCNDIEMLVVPAPGTAGQIIDAASAISPKGKTPLAASVRIAAQELNFIEDKATVILITDGLETCEADPCALASELEGQGVDFTTHVVGFGLTEEEGKQVACLAENTGGKYFPASDAEGLSGALLSTVAAVTEPPPAPEPAPEPVAEFNFVPELILAEGGEVLPKDFPNAWEIYKAKADDSEGEYVTTDYGAQYRTNLEPGRYFIRAKIDYAETTQLVDIVAGEVASPLFILNAGQLLLHPYPSAGAEIDANAAIVIDLPVEVDPTFYGDTKTWVPAGTHTVTANIGTGTISEPVTVAAGETVEKDLVVGVGRVVVNAFYADGMLVDDPDLLTKVLEAKANIQGERKEVTYAFGPTAAFDLPPGDYVALSTFESASVETPFSIKTGESTDVQANLNAGVLVITAPNAVRISVIETVTPTVRDRKEVAYSFDQTFQVTLPAGVYNVVSFGSGDAQNSKEVTVKAGERTEVDVPQ